MELKRNNKRRTEKLLLMIKFKRFLFFFFLFACCYPCFAQEYQWSVTLKGHISGETNNNPKAFLWIPSNCKQVRAVAFGQHNMCEETLFDHPDFRKTMSELGFAILWVSPGFEQQWDVKNNCQKIFDDMMADLADVSGYSELKFIPIVPIGHSAMATFPWNFAAWNPERTLAVISYHGDAPRTNLTGYGRDNIDWGPKRNIDGIPGVMIEGEYEWWEARVNPALAFRIMYPESCISFLCDVGHGHFDVSDDVVHYISLFLQKAVQYRLPPNQSLDKPTELIKVNMKKGWLAERWHPNQKKRTKPALFSNYKGDSHDAFWYFDKEMADATEKYYARSRNKKDQYIGFTYKGHLLSYNSNKHLKYNLSDIKPQEDGITYYLSAVFTDSTHQHIVNPSINNPIKIDRICGPVKKMNDSTFVVQFYRMGLDNTKRTNDICLIAHNDGDVRYKSAVQQLNLRINYPLTTGKRQSIFFPSLPDVTTETKVIELKATADSGLPVYYYVKEGAAAVDGNRLILTDIPPRAKFPVKVSVVAWQIGLEGKVQSAAAVEQSFYITK